ncbi:hypothetical protein [Bacillus sp. FSL M8-0077]
MLKFEEVDTSSYHFYDDFLAVLDENHAIMLYVQVAFILQSWFGTVGIG